jgi:3'(2'), 5'-bisphosphate nucleotidase
MLQRELETAVTLARLAGKTILNHYAAGFITEEKIGVDNMGEPVTIADRQASRIIVEGLAAAFPSDGILSEEEPDNLERRMRKDRVWIIDPMDGTAGFVKGDGDFGVQIGLTIEGSPVLGVVFLPYYDILHYAVKGSGAFAETHTGDRQKLQTSDNTDFREMGIAVSRNHLSPRINRIIEHFGFGHIVRRGSVGLKSGLIADRSCDIYIHPSPRTKLWDTCAPQIILEEAGGRLTDIFGHEIRYDVADLQNHNGILATNGPAHPLAVGHLQPLLTEFGRKPYKAPLLDRRGGGVSPPGW